MNLFAKICLYVFIIVMLVIFALETPVSGVPVGLAVLTVLTFICAAGIRLFRRTGHEKILSFFKNTIIVFLPALLLFFIIIYIRPYLGYNSNKLIVTVEEPLLRENLSIESGFFSINRESDKELFHAETELIYKGEELKQITNDYGENDYLIKYADSCYFQFRHFKTNNKQRDTYNFRIYLKDNKVYIDAEIDGTDPMNFERSFNLIRQAENLRCNVPKENAGYMYNMIELEKNK